MIWKRKIIIFIIIKFWINLLIKNEYKKNYIIYENKNYSNNPYNLISEEEKKNNEYRKDCRYKNLFENDDYIPLFIYFFTFIKKILLLISFNSFDITLLWAS